MPKVSLVKGTTSYLARIFIQDSSSTTGGGLTGLTSGSSGLVCYRARDDDGNAGGTAISLSAGTKGTWSSGGFVEKDSTNMPGVYEFGVPNAAIASGSKSVLIMFKGATNMAPLPFEIELTAFDNQDGVRAALTALPNAAAEAAGGLYTRGSGAGQINQPANGMIDGNVVRWLGTAASTPTVAGVPNVNAKTWNDLATVALPLVPTTAGRTLDVSVGGEAGVDWANVGSPTTSLALTGTTIATTQKVDLETIKTNPVVNAGTVTFPTTATLASTTNLTAGTIATVSGNVNGSVGSVTGAVGSVTGAVGSVTGNVGGNVTGSVGSIATGGIASASFAASAIDAAAIATDAIGSAELAAGAVTKIATAIAALACTEPTAVPAASPTLIVALSWLLSLSRNKLTQTATTQIMKADDGSTTVATSTVSDDGVTATRGKFA